jgi:hypothetical protein
MTNIETLPKVISVKGEYYALDLHITFKNRICVAYQFMSGPNRAMELNIPYNILSNVVEPNMGDTPVKYEDDINDIADVPNIDTAWEVLSVRVNNAISKGDVKVEFE